MPRPKDKPVPLPVWSQTYPDPTLAEHISRYMEVCDYLAGIESKIPNQQNICYYVEVGLIHIICNALFPWYSRVITYDGE